MIDIDVRHIISRDGYLESEIFGSDFIRFYDTTPSTCCTQIIKMKQHTLLGTLQFLGEKATDKLVGSHMM